MEQAKTETVRTFDYLLTFVKRKRRGIGYAQPGEEITPLSDTIGRSVLINGTPTISKLHATKEIHAEDFFFTWQDFFRIIIRGPIC